ncbi:hypothetical protein KM043_008428 [Ampulex compressa]|nr:hypothetical protein KM043_008428 [Ampulex compressa]
MSLKVIILVSFAAAAVAHKPYVGINVPFLDGRIVGGSEAGIGEYPWQVSLQWGMIFGTSHFCGGTILKDNWILTAGHCALAVPSYGNLLVKAGKHNIKKKESTEQSVKVAKMIVHENYHGGVAPYDIALMKLASPLKFNSAVQPIDLPKEDSLPSGIVVLSGWGSISRTHVPNMPETLQHVNMTIVNLADCKKSVEEISGPSPLHPTNVCTGPLYAGISACSGDSGGPLITKDAHPEVIGVVSWGIIPCGTPGAPSVYTRVSAFTKWITDTMKAN